METLEWSTLGFFPLLNVAVYWQSSNSKACAKNRLRYLLTIFIIGGEGLVSELM